MTVISSNIVRSWAMAALASVLGLLEAALACVSVVESASVAEASVSGVGSASVAEVSSVGLVYPEPLQSPERAPTGASGHGSTGISFSIFAFLISTLALRLGSALGLAMTSAWSLLVEATT